MAEQTFEPADFSSVSSGTESLGNSATRVGAALARSIVKLPSVASHQALEILTLENLWTTALILAAWLFATVVGGPVGLVVNGILVALALYQLPQLASELGALLKDGLEKAIRAKTEDDLDSAADSFAQAFSAAGLEVLQILVTHRIFVFAKPKLMRKFSVPKRIEQEHQRASNRVRDRLKESAEKARLTTAAEVAAAAGVKPAADALPTVAAVALGALAIVGTTAAVVVLAKGDRK